jgi:hypothetical protein
MTITEGLLEAVFSVGSAPRLRSLDPKPVESQPAKRRLGGWCEMAWDPVSWGLAVERSSVQEAGKKRVSCKSAAVKRDSTCDI